MMMIIIIIMIIMIMMIMIGIPIGIIVIVVIGLKPAGRLAFQPNFHPERTNFRPNRPNLLILISGNNSWLL